jgi:hypothetical protein
MQPKLIYAFLRFGCLPSGLLLVWGGRVLPSVPGWLGVLLTVLELASLLGGIFLALVGAWVLQNVYFSRNHLPLNKYLPFETWAVTADDMHNSNVDMIEYRQAFYLAHATSPFHFGTCDCELVVKRSADGKHWQEVLRLGHGLADLRDPKLAVIGDKLLLYVLLNKATQPLPYTTRLAWTGDGERWSELSSIGHEGWLFWRPKTFDGQTWYAPAYWHQFHHNALFVTRDGLNFEQVATIESGGYVNEPEIEFWSDGTLLATGRGEYEKNTLKQLLGIPRSSTTISQAAPPYTAWQRTAETQLTRLDGPVMFRHNGRIYAVGRAHPHFNRIFPRRGAALAKKRTALYEVHPTGLTLISYLPSCGDTSYAGVLMRQDCVYIAYYTNDIRKDYLWLFGMMEPTEIRMVKIALADLERAADLAGAPHPLTETPYEIVSQGTLV